MSSFDLPCIGCDSQDGCGTGMGNWPKPGDPDNNSLLTATPAFGGVDLNWTMPGTNPQAVAQVLIYRSMIPEFDSAALLVVASGSSYYDRINLPTAETYYYWIQIVSVNGTYADPIGPAAAVPSPMIDEIIMGLTGRIDQGHLAGDFKTDIAKIGSIQQDLANEVFDRQTANLRLQEAFAEVNENVNKSITYIDDEIKARTEGQTAILQRIQTLAVGNQDAFAAIRAEEIARVAADEALAQQITTVQSTLGNDIASVQQSMTTQINQVNGKVTEIGAQYTAKVTVNGLIGGFGVYNDGSTVEAGFDVDTFWVGRTNANKRKPFIIENNMVFIDEAAINSLTFTKLRDATGNLVVADGKIQARYLKVDSLSALTADMGTITAGRMQSADGKFIIDLNNKFISITV